MRIRRNLMILSGVALVASACGTNEPPEAGEVVDGVEIDDVAADRADDGGGSGAGAAATPVAMAFQAAADATTYRAEMAIGMDMSLGGMMTMAFEADPATPMMVIDVDAEGEQHTVVDMGAMMTAIFESSGIDTTDVDAMFGDMTMETWLSGDTMTMDLGGFGSMLQGTPGAANLLPAEVFTIDVARLGEGLGGPEVASAMTGQAAPDPAHLAEVLSELLGDADASDGSFSGTIGFLDFSRAFGQDPEALLGSDMGAIFDEMGGEDLLGTMLDVYEQIEVDVEGTIADGAVDTLRFDVDLSTIWTELPSIMEASGNSLPAAEIAEAQAVFADATFEMTMLFDYDLDDTIDVTVPTGDFPDATDSYLELFGDVIG